MAWPLMQEHTYLGASFEDGRVTSYLNEADADQALEGVSLFDLTGSLYTFVSGEASQSFAEALCAAEKLDVGSCSFSAVLTGDGALVSIPLVVRGGTSEYMIIDMSHRGEVLFGWMEFVRSIEQDGVKPFASVASEDASSLLVPLLVCGRRTKELLGDYIGTQELPAAGRVSSVAFDGVPCVVAHPQALPGDAFIVFAPPAFSVRLFRSFLSFPYVNPQGSKALAHILSDMPWSGLLKGSDRMEVSAGELRGFGLTRPDADYIGARGLRD